MTVAHSIFTLDGGFQLFWAAFDLIVTVVPLKVALGWEKLIFGHLKKSACQVTPHDYFFKCPKQINFFSQFYSNLEWYH